MKSTFVFFLCFFFAVSSNLFSNYGKYEKAKSRYYINKLFKTKVKRPKELNYKPEPMKVKSQPKKQVRYNSGDQRYRKQNVSFTSLMDYSRGSNYDDSLDDEPSIKSNGNNTSRTYTPAKASGRLSNVIRMARNLLGRSYRRFNTGNRSFNGDCSGFIAYIYEKNSFNLFKHAEHSSSLTRSIYSSMKARNLTHKRKLPNPGDIVFFHNSYDRNRDRRANDWYSHLGIVESVRSNGDIVFIHYLNRRRGITRDKMNLYHPNSRKRNSYLRNRYRYPHPQDRYLTGQLFAGFATLR